jgi:hypothetical protein
VKASFSNDFFNAVRAASLCSKFIPILVTLLADPRHAINFQVGSPEADFYLEMRHAWRLGIGDSAYPQLMETWPGFAGGGQRKLIPLHNKESIVPSRLTTMVPSEPTAGKCPMSDFNVMWKVVRWTTQKDRASRSAFLALSWA